MKSIRMLKDSGVGKECLIIGGGMSVKDFDFQKLPSNMFTMCINNAVPEGIKIDYLIYRDCCFIEILKSMDLSNIKNILCFRSSFYNKGLDFKGEIYGYTHSDLSQKIVIKDSDNTGIKGVVIAKHIMGFSKVYLIGFDFNLIMVDGKKQSHFYGDEVGHDKKYYEQNHLNSHYKRLPQMVQEFNRITDVSNIYNCNKHSALTLFQYAMPF